MIPFSQRFLNKKESWAGLPAPEDKDMDEKFAHLRLEDQLCFPLYACAKEIVRRYKPLLDPLDLTYTQYIAMMVLWEEKELTVKELGDRLWLDSGTLTPVLKKLESKGYLSRRRSDSDERSVVLALTEAGKALREQAAGVPGEVGCCVHLTPEEAGQLYALLYKALDGLR